MTNHGLEGFVGTTFCRRLPHGNQSREKETRDAGEVCLRDHDSRRTLQAGAKESWRPRIRQTRFIGTIHGTRSLLQRGFAAIFQEGRLLAVPIFAWLGTPNLGIGTVVVLASSVATGSISVKAVPIPTLLSTRMRPRCSSMISRHIASPNPVPPLPLASGPCLVL